MSKASAKRRAAAKQAQREEAKRNLREVVLRECEFSQVEDVHALLARQLVFPEHYGANLSALSDCLTDITTPTVIKVERSFSAEGDWFEALCGVIARCALENEALSMELVNEGSDWDED